MNEVGQKHSLQVVEVISKPRQTAGHPSVFPTILKMPISLSCSLSLFVAHTRSLTPSRTFKHKLIFHSLWCVRALVRVQVWVNVCESVCATAWECVRACVSMWMSVLYTKISIYIVFLQCMCNFYSYSFSFLSSLSTSRSHTLMGSPISFSLSLSLSLSLTHTHTHTIKYAHLRTWMHKHVWAQTYFPQFSFYHSISGDIIFSFFTLRWVSLSIYSFSVSCCCRCLTKPLKMILFSAWFKP